jgi:hypothetical protein
MVSLAVSGLVSICSRCGVRLATVLLVEDSVVVASSDDVVVLELGASDVELELTEGVEPPRITRK